jgi:hypothetical protein
MKGIPSLKPLFAVAFMFSVAGLFLQGCTEDPTAVGNGFIQSQDIPHIRIDTLPATSHGTKYTTINTAATDRLLLGKFSSYEAITLLRYTGLPTTILDTVTITSAILQLHAVYHFGDSLAPIAFSVYKAIGAWDTTSYDSLTLQQGNYYSTTPFSALAPTIVDDTSIVQCTLDTAVVNSWFTPAGSLLNYGVVLKASNSPMVKGFGSFNHATAYDRPALIIHYVNGGTPGTFTVNTGSSRFVANIPQANLILNPDLMYVQAGVAFRGKLYFNLKGLLPKAAQILRADLELTLDRNDSRLNFYTGDSLVSFYVNPDSTLALPNYSQSLIDNNGRKVYRFPVREYVRAWASSSVAQSMEFGAMGEQNSLDLFTVYGALSAPDVRPRLIITSTYIIQ